MKKIFRLITPVNFMIGFVLVVGLACGGVSTSSSRDLSKQSTKLIGHWRVVESGQDMAWDLYISPNGDFAFTINDGTEYHVYEIHTEGPDYVWIYVDTKDTRNQKGFRLSEDGMTGTFKTHGPFGRETHNIRYVDNKVRP